MKQGYKRFFGIASICVALMLAICGMASAGTFTDLQNAIDATAAGGTLTLSEDYTFDETTDAALSADGIIINRALTIEGGGKTVKAQAKTRCFKIMITSTDKVAINNLTITEGGGSHIKSGGGIYISESGNVSFDGCKIIKNGTVAGVHTQDGGAALYVESKAKVSFTNCTIAENKGQDRSGGIYLIGDAVLTSCDIRDNASGSRGGLYVDHGKSPKRGGEWGGSIRMYNCTVSGHTGGRGGGAYINPENKKENIFENCTFENNNVSANSLGYGGGILFYCAKAKMVNCKIINNKANYGGGVILDVASDVELVNCEIKGNTATVDGGGLYAFDGSHDDNSMRRVGTASFTKCVITGNVKAVSGDQPVSQDISVNYTDEATAAARREENKTAFPPDGIVPESHKEYPFWSGELWKARWDSNFTSKGYNTVGKVDNESCDTIIMLDSDAYNGKAAKLDSSGGCNAGFAGMLLLAAALLVYRKKN